MRGEVEEIYNRIAESQENAGIPACLRVVISESAFRRRYQSQTFGHRDWQSIAPGVVVAMDETGR
jgi:hypothetical protein